MVTYFTSLAETTAGEEAYWDCTLALSCSAARLRKLGLALAFSLAAEAEIEPWQ